MREFLAGLRPYLIITRKVNQAQSRVSNVTTTPNMKRSSSKSKLKQQKPKKNMNYKSSKPIQAKQSKTFRNKSNLR